MAGKFFKCNTKVFPSVKNCAWQSVNRHDHQPLWLQVTIQERDHFLHDLGL